MSKDTVILERRYVPCGEVIVTEGEEGNNAYLVQSGRVEVFSKHNDKEIILGEMGPGQIFGEMALIFDGARTASVRAVEHCNLIILTRGVIKDKLARSDATIRALMNMLTKRMIESNNALLNKDNSVSDLQDVVLNLYTNVLETLPNRDRRTFRSEVLPELNNLLDALSRFEASYEKNIESSEDNFTL